MGIEITQLPPGYGAEITGVDLTVTMDDAVFSEIEQAFETHSLLVFHGQDFDDESQIAFTDRFGPQEVTIPTVTRDRTEIANLSNVDEDGKIIDPDGRFALHLSGNRIWHTDSSFKKIPAKASLLSGREVPPEGGETEFACMRLAYDALPEEKKRSLEGVVVEHSYAYSQSKVGANLMTAEQEAALPPVPQALVRTIRGSGVKTLYVGRHTARIIDMDETEGRALLDELLEWCTQPRFRYLHKWRPKDLVIWDNRCMLHRGRPWDMHKYRRVMHRTTVAGDGPAI